MDTEQYVAHAIRTEAEYDGPKERISELIRLNHAGMGLCTEAGEFNDQLKRAIFYGKPLDEVNLIEELGDLMWYVALACDALDVSLEHVMASNIGKLKARYPEKFTEEAAENRDLDGERKVLEGEKS